ncbi:MAG: hypothetical protein HUK26_02785, partial [Duodenibacillus sp.]|nr:hypothetical protein [Duodenibacillus sp.]
MAMTIDPGATQRLFEQLETSRLTKGEGLVNPAGPDPNSVSPQDAQAFASLLETGRPPAVRMVDGIAEIQGPQALQ